MKKKKEIIKLRNVSKIYKRNEANPVHALRGVDLVVNEGDFVAVMGPSGSGKSTCMNMIGSLDTPTYGKIFLDGKDISELEESDLAQIRGKKIGFIFQQFNLIPNLTAKENVMLPMMFQGTNKEEREEEAEKLLKMVELGDRMNHYPNQLSGGQQQRVAIARALANDPEVVLADEPTGNLDTKTGDTVMNFLEKLHEKGKTIIMVTHEENLAEKNADIVHWLIDGKIKKVTKKKGRRISSKTKKKKERKK
jgi:putative ABC transport system ATP-binding protein